MPIEKIDQKLEFIEWYDNPLKTTTLKEEAAILGVHTNTLRLWMKEIEASRNPEVVAKVEVDRTKNVLDQLYQEATAERSTPSKVKAIELYIKMKGLLVEKSENKTLVMTIDDYDRITKAAESKRIEFRRGLDSGDTSLQGRPALLPSEVCEDREPVIEDAEGSQLAAVALPD